MSRTILLLLAAAGSFWLVAALVLFFGQRSMLFPAPDLVATPEDAGLDGIVSTRIAAADGTPIEVWRSAASSDQPLVLFFHGNGDINAFSSDQLALAREAGYAVAAMEYRGYNGNPGSPSEEAIVGDAETVVAALGHEGIGTDRIVLWGYSLGTGVAVRLAAKHRVKGLVLEAPFTAILDIAEARFPYFPVRLFLRDPFLSRAAAPEIAAPTLVLSGSTDEVVPPAQSRRLAGLIAGARFVSIEGAGHHDLGGSPEATRAIEGFLAEIQTH